MCIRDSFDTVVCLNYALLHYLRWACNKRCWDVSKKRLRVVLFQMVLIMIWGISLVLDSIIHINRSAGLKRWWWKGSKGVRQGETGQDIPSFLSLFWHINNSMQCWTNCAMMEPPNMKVWLCNWYVAYQDVTSLFVSVELINLLLDIIITDNYSCESILHLRFKGFLYASETQSHVDMITMQLVFFCETRIRLNYMLWIWIWCDLLPKL